MINYNFDVLIKIGTLETFQKRQRNVNNESWNFVTRYRFVTSRVSINIITGANETWAVEEKIDEKKIDSLKEIIAISLTLPKKTPLQLKIDVVIPSCSVRLLSKCCQTPQNHEYKIKLGAQLSSYRNHLENELHPCLTRIQGSETIRTFCYFTFENYS